MAAAMHMTTISWIRIRIITFLNIWVFFLLDLFHVLVISFILLGVSFLNIGIDFLGSSIAILIKGIALYMLSLSKKQTKFSL